MKDLEKSQLHNQKKTQKRKQSLKSKIKETSYQLSRYLKNTRLYEYKTERKYKKQRAKQGWCDADLFSLDWWFQDTFVDMLNNFQIRTHGHPSCKFKEVDKFPKGWIKLTLDDIKKEMINSEYNCFTKEDIEEMITNMDDYIKWKLIIKRIIHLLEESNEDKCSIKNTYFDAWYDNTFDITGENYNDNKDNNELLNKWTEKQKEIDLYRERCAKEAFELLGKYFFNLWD